MIWDLEIEKRISLDLSCSRANAKILISNVVEVYVTIK